MDGQAQRKALTAAERAIRALAADESSAAMAAATQAEELDQVGAFTGLSHAVEVGDWDAVAGAVGDGPLGALVESLR